EVGLGNAGAIAAKVGVVLQRLPGQGIIVIADAEKAAKAQNSIGDFATRFVDHDPLDGADLLIVRSINRSALHLVTANEISRLSIFKSHSVLLSFRLFLQSVVLLNVPKAHRLFRRKVSVQNVTLELSKDHSADSSGSFEERARRIRGAKANQPSLSPTIIGTST